MAGTFDFFLDAGLTSALNTSLKASGSSTDFRLWFGSPETVDTFKAQANSDPGVDQITISITDSAPGSGHETTAIKLALTQGGLTGATGGASLDLGVTVNSGASNAIEFWVRAADVIGSLATSTELGFTTNTLLESAV